MPSTTSTPATAARMPQPLPAPGCGRDSLLGRASAPVRCWSASPTPRTCRSPSVAAPVASATRVRCSSMDSCPSASALSRIWHVSLRSLSFARVPGVCRVATTMIVKVRLPSPQTRWPTSDRWRRSRASAIARPTYSGHRATAATGGGLCASAAVPAGRGVLGPHRRLGGLRRQSVPAAGREVPREAQLGDVPDLPQGTAHLGVVGVR